MKRMWLVRNTWFVLLAVVIIAGLGLFMITYQVQYNELAVVTTFGRATDESVRSGPGGDDGLHWKWPVPIQAVRHYDARVQLFEDQLEQFQTHDEKSIIVQLYLAWRVDDPLSFFRTLQNFEQARTQLRSLLRDARSQIGKFDFDELTNTDPARLKLAQAELDMRDAIAQKVADQGYGVKIEAVGVKRIILPNETAQKVFATMRSIRTRMAQDARSEGDAQAQTITSKAISDSQRILAFADRRAQDIRGKGDEGAAKHFEPFSVEPDLAIFLDEMKTLKETLAINSTFVVTMDTYPFMRLKDPGVDDAVARDDSQTPSR